MNYTKAVQKYIKECRKIINPPYNRKDYAVLVLTFLILLALPVAVLALQNRTQLNNYAAVLPPVPTVAVQHYILHGKEFFPPFAATDPTLVIRGAKGIPNEKRGLGLLAPTPILLGSTSGGGGPTKGGKKPTPTSQFPTATPGSLTPTSVILTPTPTLSNLPTSVDLSMYDMPVGYQGQINSCVSWATGYTLLGWYANRYNEAGTPYAPMYVYSQASGGQNVGTGFDTNLQIEEQQGIDTQEDYTQGNFDFADQPTTNEHTNAAHYKSTGYNMLSETNGTPRGLIENALASGYPIMIGLPVYQNFYNATANSFYVDVPSPGMTYYGSHAVVGVKYDQNGLWIENSWATWWGLNGYAELSWAFVEQYVFVVYADTGIQAPSATTPFATIAPIITP